MDGSKDGHICMLISNLTLYLKYKTTRRFIFGHPHLPLPPCPHSFVLLMFLSIRLLLHTSHDTPCCLLTITYRLCQKD
jgi:hypothetical protein